jgi:hypothetical protein
MRDASGSLPWAKEAAPWPASRNAVDARLVVMGLLIGHADQFAELPLGHTADYPALTNAHGDMPIGGACARSTHVRASLSL